MNVVIGVFMLIDITVELGSL